MAQHTPSLLSALRVVPAVMLVAFLVGCQTSSRPVSSRRLIEHQALIDFSGLKGAEVVPTVRTSVALPRRWEQQPPRSTALYTNQQWRSPSGHTGLGVAFASLPFPLSPKFVVWLAKKEYSKQAQDGKVVGEWIDPLGRYWFEAENDKYHLRGYVVTHGFGAWIIYVGYKTKYAPDLGEISLGARALETAVPLFGDSPATTQPASNSN